MCDKFIQSMTGCFNDFKPRERFTMVSLQTEPIKYPDGIIFNSNSIFEEKK